MEHYVYYYRVLTHCLSSDSLERTRLRILRQRDGEALIRTVKKYTAN